MGQLPVFMLPCGFARQGEALILAEGCIETCNFN